MTWLSTRVDSQVTARTIDMPKDRETGRPLPDTEIVYLATAGSEIEAMMWRDALRAEGITALLRQGGPGMGAWASAATFEHRVFVRADQRDAALGVLQGAVNAEPSGARPRVRQGAPRINPRSLRKPG